MAGRVSPARHGLRIIVWTLAVVVAIIATLLFFHSLGLVDLRETIENTTQVFSKQKKYSVDLSGFELLDQERLQKLMTGLDYREEELNKKEESINQKSLEVDQLRLTVEEERKKIEETAKNYHDLKKADDNITVNLNKEVDWLLQMDPGAAAKILIEMQDETIISIFKIADNRALANDEASLTPVWISFMTPQRAAEIKRKMLRRPVDDE